MNWEDTVMKKLSSKDYFIEKELSEKHSCLNYHESINNILNCQTIVNRVCKFSQFIIF